MKTISPCSRHPAARLLAVSAIPILGGSLAIACQVPVFRFALERWAADRYEVVVLHSGPLTEGGDAALGKLHSQTERSPAAINAEIRSLDVAETDDPFLTQLWDRHSDDPQRPLIVTLFPRSAREVPDRVADIVPLTAASAESLVDSPVRQEIVRRIADGDSAVWLFVPSGQADGDRIARDTLTEQLGRNERELSLPPREAIEADEFFSERTKVELRLSFSMLTLDRDDPRERFLLASLLESEPGLRDLHQPLVFPVFGRGRVLYALAGQGINERTIAKACEFIVGPCSCQVKEQNPGFDLLLRVDWSTRTGVQANPPADPSRPAEPVLLTIPPGR